MRRRIVASAFLISSALLGFPPCSAQVSSGLFYRECQADGHDDTCVGYIQGIVAGLQYGKITLQNGRNYCLPPDLGYAQATLVARKFIEEHPDLMMAQEASGTISLALVLAFPCKDQPK